MKCGGAKESRRKKAAEERKKMKKIQKGDPGYLDQIKRNRIILAVLWFAAAAVIFFAAGNMAGCIIGLLCCIPGLVTLLRVILRRQLVSVDRSRAEEILAKTGLLTTCFDLALKSGGRLTEVDCFVISSYNVYGYTHDEKADVQELSGFVRRVLEENGYTGIAVKVLDRYKPFLARVEGANNIASVEHEDTKEREAEIRRLLLERSI